MKPASEWFIRQMEAEGQQYRAGAAGREARHRIYMTIAWGLYGALVGLWLCFTWNN